MSAKETGHPAAPPLTCEVCKKEISADVAQTHEGAEYVHYFCGLECYRQWQKSQEHAKAGPPPDAR